MDESMNQVMPRARREGLLVHELEDEVLVYDLKRHKAHSLNKTAALVWQRCDGQSSIAEMARLLGQEFETEVDANVVLLGLKQLDRAHLLGQAVPRIDNSRVSRRQIMRTLGWSAAAAIPLVTSILAPTSVSAVSCVPKGGNCPPTCCAPCACNGSGKCAGAC